MNKVKLGDICEFLYGKGLPKRTRLPGEYPVYGSGGIVGFNQDFYVKGPGIIVGRKGTIGSVFFESKNFYPIDTVFYITENKKQYDIRFLYYALITLGLDKLNTDAAVPGLNRQVAHEQKLILPKLGTQQNIASILSAYDGLIDNNLKRIKILEEMAQMICREWFVNFRFPGHEKVKKVDSYFGFIPEGWEIKELGRVVSEVIDYRGKTPKKLGSGWSDYGIIALSALNVKQGRLINLDKSRFVSEELYEKWMKSELSKGDILMTSEAPLGELYYLVEREKYCLSQRLFSIRANPDIIEPVILYFSLSSPLIQKELHSRATGTTVLGIRQAHLRNVPLIIPPKNIQKAVAPIIEDFLMQISILGNKNELLRKTRDLLLPKLINGEIDVEQLDINTN